MNKQLALLIPEDGVVLLRVDPALLADLRASGQVEVVSLKDYLRSGERGRASIELDGDSGGENLRTHGQRSAVPDAEGGSSLKGVPPRATDFRSVLDSMLSEAEQEGLPSLVVRAGDLHRRVGGYPSASHRMALCCSVMRERMRAGDRILDQPPSGQGARLTVEYFLPR